MGSRQADSETLVARCQRIGWRVVRGTRGYKIYDPLGAMHTVHLTYSDIKSLSNATRELERAGLVDAEQALEKARLTETRSRNDIARQAADERAQRLAENASVARAAGPYMIEAEDVPLEWVVSAHPAPWMRWVNITPEMADKIITDHNGDNRPLDPVTVRHYRDIILAGMWHLTHQGAAFDTRGMLQDGQHRFYAIREAAELLGEPLKVPMAVFVGMPEENFKAIDEGRLRTARQLFDKGGERNTTHLQGCVRLTFYYQDDNARRMSRLRLPNQVILDQFAADPDNYRASVRWAATNWRKIPGISVPALAAAHYLIRKTNGTEAENEYVKQFFNGLTTGLIPYTRVILDDDDPRIAYRRKLARMKELAAKGDRTERRTTLTHLGMILATWNNTVTSRRIRNLIFTDDSPIPQVLRCIPGDGAKPTLFIDPEMPS